MNVAVVGAAGFAGGELLRLLLLHPEVREIRALSRSAAGRPVGEVHPALQALTDARFEEGDPAAASRGLDAVFLALEHGASSRIARGVLEARPGVLLDLAADFRVRDLDLHALYRGAHPDPELVARFTYALADVEGADLRGRRALAIPGCFATAAALALRPLALAAPSAAATLFALTGSSGAGTQPAEATHHPRRASNVQAYSVMGHPHEAEALDRWRAWTGKASPPPRLMTHRGPFVRGIYLTLHARGAFREAPAELLRRAYPDRPFVRITDGPPAMAHVLGTNLALIHAATSPDAKEIQISVAIDNLIKGAAGQAVQAMNLALGLPEDAGLRLAGSYPC